MVDVIYPMGGQKDAIRCEEIQPGLWRMPRGSKKLTTKIRLEAVSAAYSRYWATHKVEKRKRAPSPQLNQILTNGNNPTTPSWTGSGGGGFFGKA